MAVSFSFGLPYLRNTTIVLAMAIDSKFARWSMLACLLLVGMASHAQQATDHVLIWDAVSVRENKSDDAHAVSNTTDDSVTIKNLLLQYIIQTAYDYRRPNYVFGIPEWARNAKYDISAKVSPEDQARFSKLSEQDKLAMLKIVLSERFHLQAHLEMREFPTYALVIAKGGPKMATATPGNAYADGLKDNGVPAGANQIRWTGWDEVQGQAVPMSSLATVLSGTPRVGLGRPVIDQTKLTEHYDFMLRFKPEHDPTLNNSSTPVNAADHTESIFTALKEQLGLQLVPSRGSIECLVIDHLERPTPN